MKKISRFAPGFVAAVFLLSTLSCACRLARKKDDAAVYHVVVAWLKEPGNADHRAKFVEAGKNLASIPGIVSIRVGQVIPSKQLAVDSSYDIALVIGFDSPKALDDYQSHPIHVNAVNTVLTPLVKKIIVYDFKAE